MAANPEDVARQFVDFYYKTFDGDRSSLATLYRENSMLTFESDSIRGAEKIVRKLTGLPFKQVAHHVATFDAQPSLVENGIVIMVTGFLKVDGEERQMNYTQVFQLACDPSGQYFVFNDVFRLVYG